MEDDCQPNVGKTHVKGDLSGQVPLSMVAMGRYDSESNKTPSHQVFETRFSLLGYDWESGGSMLL
jgi:hypothetical protein